MTARTRTKCALVLSKLIHHIQATAGQVPAMSEEPKKTCPVTVDFGVSFEIRSLVASEQIMPTESVATVKSDAEMPIERLTDDDKTTPVELLRETIATNRCLLSSRIRKLRTILAKLEPPPPRPQPSAEANGAAEFDAGEEATPAPAAERREYPSCRAVS